MLGFTLHICSVPLIFRFFKVRAHEITFITNPNVWLSDIVSLFDRGAPITSIILIIISNVLEESSLVYIYKLRKRSQTYCIDLFSEAARFYLPTRAHRSSLLPPIPEIWESIISLSARANVARCYSIFANNLSAGLIFASPRESSRN